MKEYKEHGANKLKSQKKQITVFQGKSGKACIPTYHLRHEKDAVIITMDNHKLSFNLNFFFNKRYS